jgi:uncharacterized protein (TIGR02145 family)
MDPMGKNKKLFAALMFSTSLVLCNVLTGVAQSFTIGQKYEGGVVFYVESNGKGGLVAAPADQSEGIPWGCEDMFIPKAKDAAVGTGAQNTKAIIAVCKTGSNAARICEDLILNGYDDWFLPSRDELHLLFLQREVVGGFQTSTQKQYQYWSSSQGDIENSAYQQTFFWDYSITGSKNDKCRVRAIRSFGYKKTDETPTAVTDIDGNVYDTVTIGKQEWMVENLKTTKYNDGKSIPLVTGSHAWSILTTPGFCWYNNDAAAYTGTYGVIYNWYAVNSGNLCPMGWHVPADEEWTTLTTYLGGENAAGGKLKESGTSHWVNPNDGATNLSGFTALPGGYRQDDGSFYNINDDANWWSSTMSNTNSALGRNVNYNYSYVTRDSYIKRFGFSVRCLKDK